MEPIAIIGVACLFPDAQTPDQFWQNLQREVDSISAATSAEMGVDPDIFFDPTGEQTDTFRCKRGAYVRDFDFDPSGYALDGKSLAGLDSTSQWSLYVAKEALSDSGYLGAFDQLATCGVILGNLSFPTRASNQQMLPIYRQTVEAALSDLLQQEIALPRLPNANYSDQRDVAAPTGLSAGTHAAVTARALALGGIAFEVDAACASSLYTTKLACDYLRQGRADLMLAGAVSCADPFFINMGFSSFQAYPADGVSRPLDRHSGGLIAGEGAGMFVLKRYADARRDNDRIYALIRGIGLSNDGKGKSLLSPHPKGQMLAYERAYADADLAPEQIDYVECHATGTKLGDQTELNTMAAFFGQHGSKPLMGSVKSNLGHLLTAAGMASMIKVILSMTKGEIPATIKIREPIVAASDDDGATPKVTEPTVTSIVTNRTPWPRQHLPHRPKRAAVNAFGFGGTNAHLILEEATVSLGAEAENHIGSTKTEPMPLGRGAEQQRLAIVGMDLLVGGCDGLDSFANTIYEGTQQFGALPPQRWKGIDSQQSLLQAYGFVEGKAPNGAYLSDFAFDFLCFGIPPHERDQPIPQQLLMLKVADRAIRDAALSRGQNVAVIVAMNTDPTLHRFRGRCDLIWQIKAALEQRGIVLTDAERDALIDLAKESLYPPANAAQYTSLIGNIMASRVAAQWDFSGPAFTISSQENGTFHALDVAANLLAEGAVEAVVVGAVELAGSPEAVLLRNQQTPVHSAVDTTGDQVASLSFAETANGWLIGEGAGAVVLKRAERTQENEERIYATIDAIAIVQDLPSQSGARGLINPPSAATNQQVCRRALQQAAIQASDVGYLELCGSGLPQHDETEIAGILQGYRTLPAQGQAAQTGDNEQRCAIGSAKANVGHTFAASGMVSLIKSALCLQRRFLPATPGWTRPKGTLDWGKQFYFPTESRPWLLDGDYLDRDNGASKRIAAVHGVASDGTCAHLILSERRESANAPKQTGVSHSSTLVDTPPYLFPLAGNSQAELGDQLNQLAQELSACESGNMHTLLALARKWFAHFQENEGATYVIALVGHATEELAYEIQRARQGIRQLFGEASQGGSRQNTEWKTPLGSYFTAKPLGPHGEVAFVYPGLFNSYIGLGRDLLYLFPALHDYLETLSPKPGEILAERYLYPRALSKLSENEQKAWQAKFMADGHAMLESGTTFAALYTKLLRTSFGITPHRAFGYSLGESTMLLALGAWPIREEDRLAFRASPLFQTRITGRKDALRDYWGLSKNVDIDSRWKVYSLRATVDRVNAALRQVDQVYLTHINTPQEVVIAGDPEQCERLIATVQCDALQAPFNNVIHCAPMQSEYDEFVRINTRRLRSTAGPHFHFAANEADAPLDQQSIAHWIATGSCRSLDFPHLVERVYGAGSRIFVEVGARSTCTRWIHEILGEREHVALAVNHTRQRDRTSLVHLLAQLVSHRVAVDLSPLYARDNRSEHTKTSAPQVAKRSLVKTIRLGGEPITEILLTEENRRRFGGATQQQGARQINGHVERLAEIGGTDIGVEDQARIAVRDEAAHQPLHRETDKGQPPLEATHAQAAMIDMQHAANNDRRSQQLAALRTQIALVTKNHQALLAMRHSSSQHMAQLIQLQMQMPLPPQHSRPNSLQNELQKTNRNGSAPIIDTDEMLEIQQTKAVVWDEADLLEFAAGQIANVFGPDYEIIDSYARRVRLPMPPYLLVSRVTELDAERGQYRPSMMQTEYDVPQNAWYAVDGQVPTAIAVESGQCDLLLISYIGIDFENKGVLVYRLLDCALTFLGELPREGQTLRYDIQIDSYARSGDNLLFFFRYNCYADDLLILKMRNGCAGFFSDADLAQGKGIVMTEAERTARANVAKEHFAPLLRCDKASFTAADLQHLSRGDLAACFGNVYRQVERNRSLRYPAPEMVMIDRITKVEQTGGPWGLGHLIAEQDLAPDDWYFPCHFKDDEVLAGSLMAEGCVQLLQFYMLYLGLQTTTVDAHFQPIPNLEQVVRCRGQVTPHNQKLVYELEITAIGLSPHPYVKGYARLILDGKVIVDFQNLGLQLVEKGPTTTLHQAATHATSNSPPATRHPQFSVYHITEFATGAMTKCFGPDFAIYDQSHRRSSRTPNGDLQLMSRILQIDGERMNFANQPTLVSEYDVPLKPWFVQHNFSGHDLSGHEQIPTIPYAIYMEIALQPCGFLSAYLGSTLLFPQQDFQFRNLDGTGELLAELDLRGKTITNNVTLLSSTALEGVIIQEFTYALACDGQPFFRGTASFGYFTAEALANQRGLDGGQVTPSWLQTATASTSSTEEIRSIDRRHHLTPGELTGALAMQMPTGQLRFLGECTIVPTGGTEGKGYIFAQIDLTPDDWFFACHFYQDPVMPGSLGVEAIMEAMKTFACHHDLGTQFRAPSFTHSVEHETIWKYRGQIVPGEGPVTLELHITTIAFAVDRVTVIGDASLWKNGLRIYAIQQAALCIKEGAG